MKSAILALFLVCIPSIASASTAPVEISLALETEPPNLNTVRTIDSVSIFVLGHIMEGLTRPGPAENPHGIVPGVAERWKTTATGITFHIRKEAKWSDGKPVVASDFVFAWRRLVDPKTGASNASMMEPVKNAARITQGGLPPESLGVKAIGDRTLSVEFEFPCPYFLSLMAFPNFYPVREDVWRAKGDRFNADAADIISNGAFRLASWKHGASLTLEKSPSYWNRAQVALDRISIPYITADANAQFNFFRSGKIDMLPLTPDSGIL